MTGFAAIQRRQSTPRGRIAPDGVELLRVNAFQRLRDVARVQGHFGRSGVIVDLKGIALVVGDALRVLDHLRVARFSTHGYETDSPARFRASTAGIAANIQGLHYPLAPDLVDLFREALAAPRRSDRLMPDRRAGELLGFTVADRKILDADRVYVKTISPSGVTVTIDAERKRELDRLRKRKSRALLAANCVTLGHVTFAPEEVRDASKAARMLRAPGHATYLIRADLRAALAAGEASISDIIVRSGLGAGAVRTALNRAKKSGFVERVGRGLYRLADVGGSGS